MVWVMPRILSTIYVTASVPLFIYFANLEHELSSSKWMAGPTQYNIFTSLPTMAAQCPQSPDCGSSS